MAVLWVVACHPDDAGPGPVSDPGEVPFPIEEVPLTGFVDPMIGTKGGGNTIPGALVPHGMVRLSPDTLGSAGDVDAYEYDDSSDINDFAEASSWIYTWFVPHDVPGLMDAMGGSAAFVERLDAFFDEGHYDPSNQPSFHVPWLYAHAGQPASTQLRVRQIVDTEYGAEADGLPGNDDAGSTSAWLALSMLGLYPLSPGDGVYTLSAPRIASATVHLHPGYYDGGSFEIRTVGDPETQPYIASVTFDGEPLDRPFIDHAALVQGGVLEVELSAEPTGWGAF